MSKKLFLLPALLLGAFLFFAPACGDDDPCKDVSCGDNADCFEGDCVCRVGYEKDAAGKCVDQVDRLVGKWSTSEKCDTDPSAIPYDLTLQKSSTANTIEIFNFFNSFATSAVKATVSGNTLTIARQKPVAGGTLEVEGTGTVSVNSSSKLQIALDYKVTDTSDGSITKCGSTVLVKQ
ncbi:MAG TPA: hypothetical protein PK971_01945 [Saprospiraceae bacterium]|nr:hypothetical protein [Saprospiraceae bacterium]HND87056.1 hypothetical protein [Saprospiraceae bacterium]HNG89521.1 hypothetical protein [Saprospiraceae bacterium]